MPSRISQMRNGAQLPPQQMMAPQSSLNEEYINQLKAIMRSKNAQEYLVNTALQNPQFQQVLQAAKNGGNLQQIAAMMAKQRNVDLNQLVNQLMG